MKKLILLIPVFFVAISCSNKIIPQASIDISRHDSVTSDSVSYKETLHKTIIDVPADSSSFKVEFGCDSLRNAFIKQIADLKSKGVTTNYSFKDNTLYFTTKRDALQREVYTLEKQLQEAKAKVIHDYKYIQKPPIIITQTPKFARFCIYYFFISIAFIAGFMVVRFKLYKIFFK